MEVVEQTAEVAQEEQTCLKAKEELLGLEVEHLAAQEHRTGLAPVAPQMKRLEMRWLVF